MKKLLRTSLICCSILFLSSTAFADRRKSPLEGQPAVRHRYELRNNRFELGPSISFTINRALRQAVLFGARMEYHINDYLSLGADFGYGLSYDAGLVGEVKKECNPKCQGPDSNPDRVEEEDPKPWSEHEKHFSNIVAAGDIRLSFTPFSGKIGVFSKLFLGYDMYLFGGLAIAILANNYEGNSEQDDINQGLRLGPAAGLGVHLFFNNYISLGLEIRDLIFSDNESGGDLTRGMAAGELIKENGIVKEAKITINGDDKDFINHWLATINLTFYLPTVPSVSP